MEVNKEVEQKVDETPDEKVTEQPGDRPEENFKAELERKNREIERLRMQMVQRQEQPKQRDPNDLKTWGDHELKAVINSNDASVLPYKDQANEILLDRKVDARLARQAETHKRVSADLELRQQFPDALDPTSELSGKIEEVTSKYDLDKTPAGRLVAAKLAASELNQGKNTSDAKKTKAEQDRVVRVKGQMVDGDRPQPTETGKNLDSKRQNLAEKLMKANQPGKANEDASTAAMSEILHDRFGGRQGFFGNK